MKQKYIGLMTMLAGMLGMAGALETGCGWCTSGVLLAAGMVLTGMHYIERRKKLEMDNEAEAIKYGRQEVYIQLIRADG